MIYDKTKPPFPNSILEWEDFCDFMNKEGKYENDDPNKLRFCKNYFFITTNDNPVNIDNIQGTSSCVDWFENKLYNMYKNKTK